MKDKALEANHLKEGVYVTIGKPSFLPLAYIFEASYSMVVTSVSKKSSVDQSELEK